MFGSRAFFLDLCESKKSRAERKGKKTKDKKERRRRNSFLFFVLRFFSFSFDLLFVFAFLPKGKEDQLRWPGVFGSSFALMFCFFPCYSFSLSSSCTS